MVIAEISRVTTPRAGETPAKASVALVPVVVSPRRPTPISRGLGRPDSSFVTHLIAMAEMSPQTRSLRRAAPEDVQAAYRSVANQTRTATRPGVRMRQTA
jgi:hypothetical protein